MILADSHSEHEIANVNRKLEELSISLSALVQASTIGSKASLTTSAHTVNEALAGPSENSQTETSTPFEGESSFNAHSKRITAAFEAALSHLPHADVAQPTPGRTENVQKLLHDDVSNEVPLLGSSYHGSVTYPEMSHLSLPPMTHALKLLRLARGKTPMRVID
jgi:hypothetical protein